MSFNFTYKEKLIFLSITRKMERRRSNFLDSFVTAAYEGEIHKVKWFTEVGFPSKIFALSIALNWGRLEIVQYLCGTEIKMRESFIILACSGNNHNIEVVKSLLSYNCPYTVETIEIAVRHKHTETVQMLKQRLSS